NSETRGGVIVGSVPGHTAAWLSNSRRAVRTSLGNTIGPDVESAAAPAIDGALGVAVGCVIGISSGKITVTLRRIVVSITVSFHRVIAERERGAHDSVGSIGL